MKPPPGLGLDKCCVPFLFKSLVKVGGVGFDVFIDRHFDSAEQESDRPASRALMVLKAVSRGDTPIPYTTKRR